MIQRVMWSLLKMLELILCLIHFLIHHIKLNLKD